MRIVQIEPLENGAHRNQTSNNLTKIPNGWAVIPEEMVTENFPFGDLMVEEINGIMIVTNWIPGVIPEPEPEPTPEGERDPSAGELIDILLGVSGDE